MDTTKFVCNQCGQEKPASDLAFGYSMGPNQDPVFVCKGCKRPYRSEEEMMKDIMDFLEMARAEKEKEQPNNPEEENE